MRWSARSPEQTVPIYYGADQHMVRPGTAVLDDDGSVGDWPSLDRHADIRVNLADHAANTTCPLLAGPKISGRTPSCPPLRSGNLLFVTDMIYYVRLL